MNKIKSEGRISIIVPIYNGYCYINKCVQSILDQSYYNLELILVDDGSQDDSLLLCYEWAEKDSRVKVVKRKNGGPSAARNSGLENLSGEYLLFIDVDDYLVNDKIIEKAISYLRKGFDLVIYGWYCSKNEVTYKASKFKNQKFLSSVEASINILTDFSNVYWGGGYPWNKIWNLNKFYNKDIPKFNENSSVYEDMEWVIDMLNNLETVCILPDIGYIYHFRNDSLSHNQESFKQNYIEAISVFANLCKKGAYYNKGIVKALKSRYQKIILDAARFAHKNKYSDLKSLTKKMLHNNFFEILFNKDLSCKEHIKLFMYTWL